MSTLARVTDAKGSIVFVQDGDGTGKPYLSVDSSTSGGYDAVRPCGRRDGREDFVLTKELAKEIRAALDTYITGEERKARVAERERRYTERREDAATAEALEVGTRVQISESPVRTRSGHAATYADLFAGKVGTVSDKLRLGVANGRVQVRVPGVVTGSGHDTTDIHVSSLTVLPAEPTFTKGDRVEVVGWDEQGKGNLKWNGPATVSSDGTTLVSVDTDSGLLGAFTPKYLRPLPVPTFDIGDRATVAAKPRSAAPGATGFAYVSREFRGATVTVVANDEEALSFPTAIHVKLANGDTNYIHPAYLTKVVPPAFKANDVVKVLPTYAAEYWENGHPAHNHLGVVTERSSTYTGRLYVKVGTATYGIQPEHLEMVVPA